MDIAAWEYSGMETPATPTGQAFYKRLIEALADAGLPTSQTAIAEFLGVHQSAVSKWKSGESWPTRINAARLAQRAGVSLGWLLTGDANRKQEPDMDEKTLELLLAWDRMPPAAQDEFLAFVRFRVEQAKAAGELREEPKDTDR